MFVAWGSGDCYVQKDSLHHLETVDMGSQLEFCSILMLTSKWFLTFCSPARPISPATELTVLGNSHVWNRDTTNIPVILMPTFWKMNSQPLQKMFLCERDVYFTSMAEAPCDCGWVITHYLIQHFFVWWIGHGSVQNWPPWSVDLNPLDYHVKGHMKVVSMVYAHKVNTGELP
jgi:hypothetical protein